MRADLDTLSHLGRSIQMAHVIKIYVLSFVFLFFKHAYLGARFSKKLLDPSSLAICVQQKT